VDLVRVVVVAWRCRRGYRSVSRSSYLVGGRTCQGSRGEGAILAESIIALKVVGGSVGFARAEQDAHLPEGRPVLEEVRVCMIDP
jgi:hypothetical protein